MTWHRLRSKFDTALRGLGVMAHMIRVLDPPPGCGRIGEPCPEPECDGTLSRPRRRAPGSGRVKCHKCRRRRRRRFVDLIVQHNLDLSPAELGALKASARTWYATDGWRVRKHLARLLIRRGRLGLVPGPDAVQAWLFHRDQWDSFVGGRGTSMGMEDPFDRARFCDVVGPRPAVAATRVDLVDDAMVTLPGILDELDFDQVGGYLLQPRLQGIVNGADGLADPDVVTRRLSALVLARLRAGEDFWARFAGWHLLDRWSRTVGRLDATMPFPSIFQIRHGFWGQHGAMAQAGVVLQVPDPRPDAALPSLLIAAFDRLWRSEGRALLVQAAQGPTGGSPAAAAGPDPGAAAGAAPVPEPAPPGSVPEPAADPLRRRFAAKVDALVSASAIPPSWREPLLVLFDLLSEYGEFPGDLDARDALGRCGARADQAGELLPRFRMLILGLRDDAEDHHDSWNEPEHDEIDDGAIDGMDGPNGETDDFDAGDDPARGGAA